MDVHAIHWASIRLRKTARQANPTTLTISRRVHPDQAHTPLAALPHGGTPDTTPSFPKSRPEGHSVASASQELSAGWSSYRLRTSSICRHGHKPGQIIVRLNHPIEYMPVSAATPSVPEFYLHHHPLRGLPTLHYSLSHRLAFRKMIHIKWYCTGLLRPPRFREGRFPTGNNWAMRSLRLGARAGQDLIAVVDFVTVKAPRERKVQQD